MDDVPETEGVSGTVTPTKEPATPTQEPATPTKEPTTPPPTSELVEIDLMREIESLMTGDDEEDGRKVGVPEVVVTEAEEEIPLTYAEMEEKLKELEKERGQLTAETLEKESSLDLLTKEVSSLKAAVQQRDEDHALAMEEEQTKFRLLQEETTAKIEEVRAILMKILVWWCTQYSHAEIQQKRSFYHPTKTFYNQLHKK